MYVQYLPNTNDETGIEGWYCTYKAGMKTVGCCAYIASVIYYLACGKYLKMLPNPAGLLTFFFTNKAKPETSMLTQIETSEDEVYESKKLKNFLKKKSEINLVSSSESFDDHSSIDEDKSIKNKKHSQPNKQDVVSPKKLKVTEKQSENSWFFSNIPKWGGKLIKLNFKKPVKLLNACTIDYFLLALWTSSKLSKNILINLKNSDIKEKIASIIGFIDSNNWNKAKSIWLLDVCKLCVSQDENGNHSICTFGTEMERFINFIKPIQSFESQVVCNNQLCMRSLTRTINDLYLSKVGEDVVFNFFLKKKCSYCSHQL